MICHRLLFFAASQFENLKQVKTAPLRLCVQFFHAKAQRRGNYT